MSVFPDQVRVEVRLDNGTVWTELPDVLINTPILIARGNDGTSQRDRVATTGTMTFRLDNADDNSGNLLGFYSPNNVNCFLGWRVGVPIRCVIQYAGTDYTVFAGNVESIEPVSGKYKERYVTVYCTDWMEEAARSKIRGLPLQIDQLSSKVFEVVANAVERPPVGGFNVKPGADTYPYALDSSHEGEFNAMSEFQRLAQSELGRIYVTREGTATFEGRHHRPNVRDVFIFLTDEDIDGVEAGRGREEIINHAEIEVHPRRVDIVGSATVLSELAGSKKIERNTTSEVNVLFRDPESRATRVGGRDMLQPNPNTDYIFNSQQDGLGVDLTFQLDVNVVYSANGGLASITNNGPSDGYLTKFQTRGRGIYDYETVLVSADSQASKDKYGEAGFSLDMPYQANFGVAQDAATFIVQQSKELLTQIRAVRFFANREDRLMLAAILGEISDKIGISETVIGSTVVIVTGEDEGGGSEDFFQTVSVDSFFINAVRLEINERGIIRCTWVVEPSDLFSYWILEDPVQGVLNRTTRLAFGSFTRAWVLDFDQLDAGTRLGES